MAPPINSCYIIHGEMSLVVMGMKRTSRWNSVHQPEDDPLMKEFLELKNILQKINDVNELEPNVFLSPFLDVIRSEDTTGPVTGLALSSVNKFLCYGLIEPGTESAAAAIENVADAVTHARFVGTDPSSDEVVLMKILHVLRTLMLSSVGIQLTNESICEIMQSCFRICFEMRLSELLRKSAEQTLVDMVQLLFSRLPQFKEMDNKFQHIRKLKMRAGHLDNTRGGKARKKSPRLHPRRFSPSPSPLAQTPASSCTSINTVGTAMHDDAPRTLATGAAQAGVTPADYVDTRLSDAMQQDEGAGSSTDVGADTTQGDGATASVVTKQGNDVVTHANAAQVDGAAVSTDATQVDSVTASGVAVVTDTSADVTRGDEEEGTGGEDGHHQGAPMPAESPAKATTSEQVTSEDQHGALDAGQNEESVAASFPTPPISNPASPAPPSTLELQEKHVVDVGNINVTLSTTPMTPGGQLVDMAHLTLDSESYSLDSSELENAKTSEQACAAQIAKLPQDVALHSDGLSEDVRLDKASDVEHISICSEKSDEQSLEGAEGEYVTSRGVRFTQHHVKDTTGKLLPHGLPCVRELARFLASLINQHDKHNTDVMMHMGLSLLTVALETGADHMGHFNSLLGLVKDEMCKHLFILFQSERLTLFSAALRVCFLLFESLRTHLKFQLEMYLTKLMDIIVSENPRIPYEQKEIALDHLVALWRIPGLVTELYLNYDCDLYCSNLFEDITKLLSKNCFPVSGLYTTHVLSLDALLAVIDSIESHCVNRMLLSSSKAPPATTTTMTDDAATTTTTMTDDAGDDVGDAAAAVSSSHREGSSDMSGADSDGGATAQCQVVAAAGLQPSDRWEDGQSGGRRKAWPQSGSVKQNRMKISTNIPTEEDLIAMKKKKKLLQQGTELFNHKPSKGIQHLQEKGLLSDPHEPGEVVSFLRENPHLDKKMIGEYISNRKNLKILEAFVKSFNFDQLRVDEALRQYLETFRLPGEAPVISLLLEHFAEHWHKTNGEPFANSDAAFTLAYAVIMLNVDQHNYNVKKNTIPMTLDQYRRNVSKVNGGQDFDQDMLEEIYNATKSEEIVMPAEQMGLVRENYLWKVLLRRGVTGGCFIHTPSGQFDHDLFVLAWGPTVAALSFVFDKSTDEMLIAKAIQAFRKCATVSAYYSVSDVFDNLVISLCKFTTLLSAHEAPEQIPVSFGGNMKAQLSAKTVFALTHRHGDILREGWKNIVDCLLQLYKAKLLPQILVEVEDFCDVTGRICLIREETQNNPRAESGIFSSFYNYLTLAQESPTQKVPTPEDEQAMKNAQLCIKECHPEQLLTESKFLRLESLHELVKALVYASQGPESHFAADQAFDEDAAVFNLELLIRVALQNRDRVAAVWQVLRDHIYSLVVNAQEHTFLLERSVIGLLRLAIRLLRRDEIAYQVVVSLRMLLLAKACVLYSVSRHVAYGLHELLRTNAANIHTKQDWFTLFALLECVGAGAAPPSVKQVTAEAAAAEAGAKAAKAARLRSRPTGGAQSDSEIGGSSAASDGGMSDRGYTSDSELYENKDKLEVHPVSSSEGWMVVKVTGDNADVAEPSPPAPPPPPPPPQQQRQGCHGNQFSISLMEELHYHEPRTFLRSCESLAFLVRDAAHVTPDNFESCVHALRTFVEASLNGGRYLANRKQLKVPVTDKKLGRKKSKKKEESGGGGGGGGGGSSKGGFKRSRSTPNNMNDAGESDDENQDDSYTASYHQASLQLLDLMHTLHTRAASIYSSWEMEDGDTAPPGSGSEKPVEPASANLWESCWCPLLQGIARLCCDARRQVRMTALTYLQRALLVHDLHRLTALEWENCFNTVLFPLLARLLDNICPQDPLGMEETRVRGATLLCKVFLQHLTPLLSLSTFTALWLTILDFMDKYMHADQGDLLFEAIPESLKNMLLVMDTADVFGNRDDSKPSKLWVVTWDRIDAFLPELKKEVFKERTPSPERSVPVLALPRDDVSPLPDQPTLAKPGAEETSSESSTCAKQATCTPAPPVSPLSQIHAKVKPADCEDAAGRSVSPLSAGKVPSFSQPVLLAAPLPPVAAAATIAKQPVVKEAAAGTVLPVFIPSLYTSPSPGVVDPRLDQVEGRSNN